MRSVLKQGVADLFWWTGVTTLFRKLFPSSKVTVLMYHKVEGKSFEKQVAYLKKHYTVIAEKDLYDFYYKKKQLPKNSVLLTFDDGYLNNYEVAYPVLKKYDAPAIIFLTTGFIGQQKMPWYDLVTYLVMKTKKKSLILDGEQFILNAKGRSRLLTKYYHYMITADEEEFKELLKDLETNAGVAVPKVVSRDAAFMSWEQAREMQPLVAFGSHTVHHPVIPNISEDSRTLELCESKKLIEKKLGGSCLSFCFPNGDFSADDLVGVKTAGYKLSFSTLFGRNSMETNRFRIKRVGINVGDTKAIFAFKLSRLSNLFKKWKQSSHFRVVMLTNYYFPQQGGITSVVHQLHVSLLKNNIKSTVIPFPHFFRKMENLFANAGLLHKLFVVLYIVYVECYILFLRLFHKKIIVHSHSANFCARAASLSRVWGTKTMHTFHTHLGMGMQKHRHLEYFNKLDALTSVSASLGEENKKAFNIQKPIKTIFNGVMIPEKKKNLARDTHKSMRLLFVGHFFAIKDPLLFVRTVERLVAQGKTVEAIMIGEGDLRVEVESYIAEKGLSMIRLLGIIPREKVSEYYRWADVFVSTSVGEGLPVVILEALAMGTPVVATNSGGSAEIIRHLQTGYLVQSRNENDLCRGILYALMYGKKLSHNASLAIKSNFDWERIIHKYIKLYRRLSLERGVENSEE